MEFDDLLNGRSVDWVKTKKRLLKKGHSMQTISTAFNPAGTGLLTSVNILNDRLAKDLLGSIVRITSSDSRVEATKKGDSHRAKTSSGIVNIYPAGESFPRVVICSGDDYQSEFNLAKEALIIENIELFLRLNETLSFISDLCSADLPVDDMDVVFGAGNAISSAHNRTFLGSYQRLFCLFDIDQGGLEAHKNLSGLVGREDVAFLYPVDIDQRLDGSIRSLTPQQEEELSKFKSSLPIHNKIKAMILKSYKTLEQEDYLHG